MGIDDRNTDFTRRGGRGGMERDAARCKDKAPDAEAWGAVALDEFLQRAFARVARMCKRVCSLSVKHTCARSQVTAKQTM